jgi:hypothetical protein
MRPVRTRSLSRLEIVCQLGPCRKVKRRNCSRPVHLKRCTDRKQDVLASNASCFRLVHRFSQGKECTRYLHGRRRQVHLLPAHLLQCHGVTSPGSRASAQCHLFCRLDRKVVGTSVRRSTGFDMLRSGSPLGGSHAKKNRPPGRYSSCCWGAAQHQRRVAPQAFPCACAPACSPPSVLVHSERGAPAHRRNRRLRHRRRPSGEGVAGEKGRSDSQACFITRSHARKRTDAHKIAPQVRATCPLSGPWRQTSMVRTNTTAKPQKRSAELICKHGKCRRRCAQ